MARATPNQRAEVLTTVVGLDPKITVEEEGLLQGHTNVVEEGPLLKVCVVREGAAPGEFKTLKRSALMLLSGFQLLSAAVFL